MTFARCQVAKCMFWIILLIVWYVGDFCASCMIDVFQHAYIYLLKVVCCRFMCLYGWLCENVDCCHDVLFSVLDHFKGFSNILPKDCCWKLADWLNIGTFTEMLIKGIVHFEIKMWYLSAYPKGIQDVGVFFSSVDPILMFLGQTVLVCQSYNGRYRSLSL